MTPVRRISRSGGFQLVTKPFPASGSRATPRLREVSTRNSADRPHQLPMACTVKGSGPAFGGCHGPGGSSGRLGRNADDAPTPTQIRFCPGVRMTRRSLARVKRT